MSASDPGSSNGTAAETALLNATFAATLVDEWVRAGVTDAVVAPGSRSTPMAVALADRAEVAVHVHLDERSAGFVALGLGAASGRPAVVLTTSGTAAVELHPAVVEADLGGVPLLAVTANRPPELHDVGAPQTVDQVQLFGRSTRWFAAPGPPEVAARSAWRSLASRAVAEAVDGPVGPGPVHLDVAFREPLVGRAAELPPGRDAAAPWHMTGGHRIALDRRGAARLAELADRDRGVIVAGRGSGDPNAVLALADATGWPVLADARSGCRIDHPSVVAHADAVLRVADVGRELAPEVVVRLGAPPASKVVGAWLAGSGARQVAVDGHGRWFDADRTAALVLRADPTAVATALARLVGRPATDEWTGRWARVEAAAAIAIDRVLADDGLTEPAVARAVVRALGQATAPQDRRGASVDVAPPGPGGPATLVVSSSMPVRDVEWFGGIAPGVRVLSNRGANGIDGVVSTAVGAALAVRGTGFPTVALVGDVAFVHDTNGLVGLQDRGVDLTIVVVDNDGGGIFSFLPPAAELPSEQFEELFATPHGVEIPLLAAAHGIVTVEPHGADDLAGALEAALSGGVQLVRVRTDRADNVAHHRALHDAVAAELRDGRWR